MGPDILTLYPFLNFVRTFCVQGMQYLHNRRRLHRDLKSGNLLITEGWVVKVADFGTSKIISTLRSRLAPSAVWKQPAAQQGLLSGWDLDKALTRGIGTLLWTGRSRRLAYQHQLFIPPSLA